MHTTSMSAARKLLTAGQARADKLIAQTQLSDFNPLVRNLCAEVAMFDPEDGSISVEWKNITLFVHIPSEQIQVNGCDISGLLPRDDVTAILCLAEEAQRQQWVDDAAEVQFRRAA
jgi:hypothetical protein